MMKRDNKKKIYMTLIAAVLLIIIAAVLTPSYRRAVKKDHLDTCEKVRHIIYWRYGTVMKEYLEKGEFTEDDPDYEAVVYESIRQTLGVETADKLEKTDCDRSDMMAEFLLPDMCREGGTIQIYVKDLYHLNLFCTAQGHENPIT